MANTLTGLIPTLYEAVDVVSREMVGFIPAVARNTSAERAALGQTITVPIAPIAVLADVTPGVTPPDAGDQTIGKVDMTISKSRRATVRFNGEETLSLQGAGTYSTILRDRFLNAFRGIVNEMEADLWAAAYKAASRAYGTAGTTPFATAGDMSDMSQVARILDDNGAPILDRHAVLGSAAVANLRGKQDLVLKQNESGSDAMLRRGAITELPLLGFDLHTSGAVGIHTKGTGASYLANGAVAVGGTSVAVDTGSGTILAGDIVTYAADVTNKYVVGTALSGGVFALNQPGALVAIPDNNAITVGNNYTANVVFSRNAIQLICRAPALPEGGDMADDRMFMVDPVSNVTFEIAVYRQYRQVSYEIAAAWGVKGVKGEHIAILLG